MIELVFLGTAASAPSAERGLPAVLVRHGPRRFLVDCGEGTLRQLLKAGFGLKGLDKALLTHGHLDHMLGLGGLASTANMWRTTDTFTVFAGPWALGLSRVLLEQVVWPEVEPPIDLRYVPVETGVIYEEPVLQVRAFPVRHSAPDSFGYLFAETPHRPLIEERLDALGVPRGPERSRLAAGESVVLPDGRTVAPEEVVGPAKAAARVAVIGDTEGIEDLVEPVRGVDLLVIESTFLARDAEKARLRSHITAAEAATLAREAGVGRLCLTHLSGRYKAEEIRAEAEAIFTDTHVAQDFDVVRVPEGD